MLIMIPGWHEPARDMRTLVIGRNGKPGFLQYGYTPVLFPTVDETFEDRIRRFAFFLTNLRLRHPDAGPFAVVGYSAGGLIARGFLRAYPERSPEIACTIQIGAPNTGLIDKYLVPYTAALRMPWEQVNELDVASDFLRWLNGTGGHWQPTADSKHMQWKLDGPPIVAPAGARIHAIVGRVPRFGHSDGVIRNDSAALEEHIPYTLIEEGAANHMNLAGVFNIAMFVYKGFVMNDQIWPRVVAAAHDAIQDAVGTSA